MKVTLTPAQIAAAYLIGGLREGASAGVPNRYDAPRDAHIMGTLGECAVAGAMNRFWPMTVNAGHAPDIPPDHQVRARMFDPENGHHDLCMRPGDDPTHWYVLTHCHQWPDVWDIVGRIIGQEAIARGTRLPDGRIYVRPDQMGRPNERG